MKFAMGPPIFASSRTHDIASASPSRAAAAHAVVASFAYLLISNCSLIFILRAWHHSSEPPSAAAHALVWRRPGTPRLDPRRCGFDCSAMAALTCVRCVSVSESGRPVVARR